MRCDVQLSQRPDLHPDAGRVAHDFQVLAFDGHEAIGQPYRFQLELVSERPDWPLESLLQRSAFLALGAGDRGIHGQLAAVAQGDSGRRLTRYRAELVPRLAQLAHRVNSRLFQGRSVPEILAQLLGEHGILDGDYRFALGPTRYPPRAYCVQYGESDLAFLTRLCEEEGLHFHHQHRRDGHVLVFGDDATSFAQLGATRYLPGSGLVADEPRSVTWRSRCRSAAAPASCAITIRCNLGCACRAVRTLRPSPRWRTMAFPVASPIAHAGSA